MANFEQFRNTFPTALNKKGHTNGDITTHYSPVEIGELYTALERLV